MPRGRPAGSHNARAQVPGWHNAAEEAKLRGITIIQLQRQVRDRIGPLPVKIGQQVLFKDGSLGEYLEALHRRRNEPQPTHRGRPRKYGIDQAGAAPLMAAVQE
jgi:hypothetical protein